MQHYEVVLHIPIWSYVGYEVSSINDRPTIYATANVATIHITMVHHSFPMKMPCVPMTFARQRQKKTYLEFR